MAGCLLVAVFGFQYSQISKLKHEVAALRRDLAAPPAVAPDSPKPLAPVNLDLQERLARLEQRVTVMSAGNPRRFGAPGPGPAPTEQELAQMEQRLVDPAATDGDRLNALHLLRRNGKLTDNLAVQAVGLLGSTTNAAFRRELLAQMQGSTNAALKEPLLSLLNSATGDTGFRSEVIGALRNFASDPAVESKLWDVALNDANTRVRDQAREALARAPATPERVDQLTARAANPDASLDERLVSFRALRLAKSYTPDLVNDFANLAQNTTDPIAKAKLFKAFNGLTDESLMLPLVNGLQDTDPIVRQNAVNALSEFPDPRVQQWLSHLIQNDTDPSVKREAHAALERTQRLANHPPQ
jgi:hypothetical protein